MANAKRVRSSRQRAAWRAIDQAREEAFALKRPVPEQVFAPMASARARPLMVKAKQGTDGMRLRFRRGRRRPSRQQAAAGSLDGHAIRAVRPMDAPRDVAIGATMRAAAIRRSVGGRIESNVRQRLAVDREDLRVRLRQPRVAGLILFVVDSSGSMGARRRMAMVKGVLLDLLLDAYQRRDRVGLIAFRRESAQLLVPPTNSVEVAERQLRVLPTGGRTPLTAGLQMAAQLLEREAQRRSLLAPLLVLVTDGRSNVGPSPMVAVRAINELHVPVLVLDSEEGYVKLGKARRLAQHFGAEYARLDEVAGRMRMALR